MYLCRCVPALRVFLLQSLHPKIQVTKPTRAREHFKEFWKAKLLFIFLFVAFVSLTSEVWDVEIKKHLGLKQFAIMHGVNGFFGLVSVEGFETTLCTLGISHVQ